MRDLPIKNKPSGSSLLFPPEELPAAAAAAMMATTTEKAHGRIEKRMLRTSTILTKHQDWAGLRQGFQVVRERTEHGKKTVEVVHGISSGSRACERVTVVGTDPRSLGDRKQAALQAGCDNGRGCQPDTQGCSSAS